MIKLHPRFAPTKLGDPNRTVFLDKYTGDWFSAPQAHLPLLQLLKKGLTREELGCLPSSDIEALRKLAEDGALSPPIPREKRKLSPERGQVTLIIIEALNYCNLACTYCFENVPLKGKKMTFETAERIVASIQRLNLADSFVVEFNGGESFANLPILKHIVKCIEESPIAAHHNISYGVTSNLTVLTSETIEFLRANRFSISVSVDGPADDHDRHRVNARGNGSHAQVIRNTKRLKEAGVEFCTVSVISQPGQLTRAYEFLLNERVPYVSFAIRRHSDRMPLTDVSYQGIADELVDVLTHSLDCFKNQQFAPKVMDGVIMIRNIIEPHDSSYMCLRTPCGAGINMITYDTSGDIYACQDLIKQPEFRISNISDQNPQATFAKSEVIRRLRSRKPGDNEGCEECNFQNFCQGGCYSTSFHASGKDLEASFRTRTPHCEFYYHSFSRLFKLVAKEGSTLISYLQSTPYLLS